MPGSDDAVEFLSRYPPAVRELALALRRTIADAVPGVLETVDRSSSIIGYGLGPGYTGLICTIIPSKGGVKLGMVGGATLPDPKGILKGSGKKHRYVALETLSDLRQPGLKPLLKAGLRAWKARASSRV